MEKLRDALPQEEAESQTPNVLDKVFLPTAVKHQLARQEMDQRFQDFNRWSQMFSEQGSADECPTFNNQAAKEDDRESMRSFEPAQ